MFQHCYNQYLIKIQALMDRNVKKENALLSVQSTLLFTVISMPRIEKIILQDIFQVLDSTPIWCSSKSRLSKFLFFIVLNFLFIITQYCRLIAIKTSKGNLFLMYWAQTRCLVKRCDSTLSWAGDWFWHLRSHFRNVGKILLPCTSGSVRNIPEGFIFTETNWKRQGGTR